MAVAVACEGPATDVVDGAGHGRRPGGLPRRLPLPISREERSGVERLRNGMAFCSGDLVGHCDEVLPRASTMEGTKAPSDPPDSTAPRGTPNASLVSRGELSVRGEEPADDTRPPASTSLHAGMVTDSSELEMEAERIRPNGAFWGGLSKSGPYSGSGRFRDARLRDGPAESKSCPLRRSSDGLMVGSLTDGGFEEVWKKGCSKVGVRSSSREGLCDIGAAYGRMESEVLRRSKVEENGSEEGREDMYEEEERGERGRPAPTSPEGVGRGAATPARLAGSEAMGRRTTE